MACMNVSHIPMYAALLFLFSVIISILVTSTLKFQLVAILFANISHFY